VAACLPGENIKKPANEAKANMIKVVFVQSDKCLSLFLTVRLFKR